MKKLTTLLEDAVRCVPDAEEFGARSRQFGSTQELLERLNLSRASDGRRFAAIDDEIDFAVAADFMCDVFGATYVEGTFSRKGVYSFEFGLSAAGMPYVMAEFDSDWGCYDA